MPPGCWKLNLHPLREQSVFLTAEPSLQAEVGLGRVKNSGSKTLTELVKPNFFDLSLQATTDLCASVFVR